MNYYALSSGINFITSICLAVFLWLQNTKQARSFSLVAFSVAFWSINYFFWQMTHSMEKALLFCNLLSLGSIWIPATFIHFIVRITKPPYYYRILIPSYFLAVMFSYYAVDGSMVVKVSPALNFEFWPRPSTAYHFFLAYFIGTMMLAHVMLYQTYRRTSNQKEMKQIQYIFIGTFAGFIGGSTNYFLWYGIPIKPFGNILVSLYVATIAYSIIRHQLMDIEIIIKKAMVFGGLFGAIFAAVSLMTFTVQRIFEGVFQWNDYTSLALNIGIIIVAFRPLEQWLKNVTDKYLFQKKFEYKEILKLFIEDVLKLIDLEKIINGTRELLDSTIHPKKFSVYLPDQGNDTYINQFETPFCPIMPGSPLVVYLKERSELLCVESNHTGISKEIIEEMKSLNAAVAIPLETENKFLGFMLLGKKKSDEEYSQGDLDILRDLSKTKAIAIMNAKRSEEMIRSEADSRIGRLADGMSHQYNNYFNSIIAELDVKLEDLPEHFEDRDHIPAEERDKKRKEALMECFESFKMLKQDALRGGELATSVLNYTRAGKVGFKVQQINDGVGLGIRFAQLTKGKDFGAITITTDAPDDLPPTYCNMSHMQNILQIPLTNSYDAIKFRQRTEPDHDGKIHIMIRSRSIDNSIRIVIEDNGMGIKEQYLSAVKAQVPYFTTKGSSVPKSGFGAGINFLSYLVKMHKGTVDYESEYGKWTKCIIDIPIRGEPKKKEEAKKKS